MRWCAMVLLTGFALSLQAEPKWLVVLGTSSSVQQAVARANHLRNVSGKMTVVVSDDCINLKPGLFLTVAGILNDDKAAQRLVTENRKIVPDAYPRACEPRPGSRVQFGIDAVDPSIFKVPPNAVNWDDRDRISEVHAEGQTYVWLRRRYVEDKNDPREGRRTGVLLFNTNPLSARQITPDCFDAQVAGSDHNVALACARENAGDNLLHQMQVIDTNSGQAIRTLDRCRNPKFVTSVEVTCDAEAVGADGKLKLTPTRIVLKVEVRSGTRGRPL